MNYIYFLANASLTLRVIDYANTATHFPNSCLTVINRIDGWIVLIKFDWPLTPKQDGDFQAFMKELGKQLKPDLLLQKVFWSLEVGKSLIEVMRRYEVAIVSHGHSNRDDVEAFCLNFRHNLGCYPETLA